MDFYSSIISSIAIVVSGIAIGVSFYTFKRKEKSDEFRIALDVHNKLESLVNEIITHKDDVQIKRSKSLEYLNTWEFFAFLINNNEIQNQNIHEFFNKSLCDETDQVFQDYPDIANNKVFFLN